GGAACAVKDDVGDRWITVRVRLLVRCATEAAAVGMGVQWHLGPRVGERCNAEAPVRLVVEEVELRDREEFTAVLEVHSGAGLSGDAPEAFRREDQRGL